MHAMGLGHPFDGRNTYMFKENHTQNIMDYSHNVGIDCMYIMWVLIACIRGNGNGRFYKPVLYLNNYEISINSYYHFIND